MSDNKFKVLFVCTGNTCRSPMAEGILRNMLEGKNIEGIEVSSTGISAIDNFPAAENAVIVCRDWGIDISGHRSRLLDMALMESSDLMLAMSPEHYRYIKSIAPSIDKTFLIKEFPEKTQHGIGEGVADPIGGSLEQYGRTFLELDETIRKILPDIIGLSQDKTDNI